MIRRLRALSYPCLLITSALCLALTAACSQKSGGETFVVSVDNTGDAGEGGSGHPAISADGRFVVFWSWAPNITSDAGLEAPHVVLRDGALEWTSDIGPSDLASFMNTGVASITPEGRDVAFSSRDPAIVSGDSNDDSDVFVRHSDSTDVVRVSVNSAGEGANGGASEPSISADGRHVAFSSYASNLVPGDTNGTTDVFVHDLDTAETMRVSVGSQGEQGNGDSWQPSISGDGRYVAFTSLSTNLVKNDTNETCDVDEDGFSDDNCPDVFVHDLVSGQTMLASVLSDDTQGNGMSLFPDVSDDGRYVVFASDARNFLTATQDAAWGFFVRDREKGMTTRVGLEPRGGWMDTAGGAASALWGGMWGPAISGDGKWVAFVEGFNVVVVRIDGSDRELVSVNSAGEKGNGSSSSPSISSDGRYVAFSSFAGNLVPGVDGKRGAQVYVRKRPVESRIIPKEGYTALLGAAVLVAVLLAFRLRVRRAARGV